MKGRSSKPFPKATVRVEREQPHGLGPHLREMRSHYIRIPPGDRVQVELTPYDLSPGRSTYRYK